MNRLKCPKSKSLSHCLTVSFQIYQNKHEPSHGSVPSTHCPTIEDYHISLQQFEQFKTISVKMQLQIYFDPIVCKMSRNNIAKLSKHSWSTQVNLISHFNSPQRWTSLKLTRLDSKIVFQAKPLVRPGAEGKKSNFKQKEFFILLIGLNQTYCRKGISLLWVC